MLSTASRYLEMNPPVSGSPTMENAATVKHPAVSGIEKPIFCSRFTFFSPV